MRQAVLHTIIIGVLLGSNAGIMAQGDDSTQTIARIVGEWNKRQVEVQTVRYVLSGTLFYPKGKWDGQYQAESSEYQAILARKGSIPPQDTRLPYRADLLLELNQNWARKEEQWHALHHRLAEFIPHQTTNLFNGKTDQKYEPRENNTSENYTPSPAQPDLMISSGGSSPIFFAFEDYPVLWACGSIQTQGLVAGNLRPKCGPDDLVFRGRGQVQGRPCVVVRTRESDPVLRIVREYWVDTGRESAILRCVGYSEGQCEFQTDVQYEQRPEMWLPVSWRCTYYEVGQLDRQFDLKAESITINPSVREADFEVPFRRGMVVRFPEKDATWVVGRDGKTLLPFAAALDEERRYLLVRNVLLFVLSALLVVAAAWYLRRRWRKRVAAA